MRSLVILFTSSSMGIKILKTSTVAEYCGTGIKLDLNPIDVRQVA